MKKKLIAAIQTIAPQFAEKIADILIEKGWIIPTHCKDCRQYDPGYCRPYLGWCSEWERVVRETGFCHNGEPLHGKDGA